MGKKHKTTNLTEISC